MAVCGPCHFGADGIVNTDGDGIYGGRDSAGKTGSSVWDAECRVWNWVCGGAGAGRRAGKYQSADAVLGGGRVITAEWDVRVVCAAGVVAEGAAQEAELEARESGGVAGAVQEGAWVAAAGWIAADGLCGATVTDECLCDLCDGAVWVDGADGGNLAGGGGRVSRNLWSVSG